MNRRTIVASIGAAAVASLPLAAQPADKVRRIGFLGSPNDPTDRTLGNALRQELRERGWIEGSNLRLNALAMDRASVARNATQLVSLMPDVLIARASPALKALMARTRSIPIVFTDVTDPVGQGFVTNLARPGGNITGFANWDFPIVGKWLQLLKEIAPRTSHVLGLSLPTTPPKWRSTLDAMAGRFGLEPSQAVIRNDADIERALAPFARAGRGALLAFPTNAPFQLKIVAAAAKRHLPSIHGYSEFAEAGGLIAYGPNVLDLFRGAADYADRILRGARPGDLPVQDPTKFVLAINLKTARALGLTIPQSLLIQADDVVR